MRVVHLEQEGFDEEEISLLVQMSPYLVSDYLAVYEQNDTSFCRQRLQEQLTRINNRSLAEKRGAV